MVVFALKLLWEPMEQGCSVVLLIAAAHRRWKRPSLPCVLVSIVKIIKRVGDEML